MNVLSKITTTYTAVSPNKETNDSSNTPTTTLSSLYSSTTANTSDVSLTSTASTIVVIPPSLTTDSVLTTDKHTTSSQPPTEFALKSKSLECLVSVLRSLVAWYNKGAVSLPTNGRESEEAILASARDSEDFANLNNGSSHEQLTNYSNSSNHRFSPSSSTYSVANGTDSRPAALDDPEQFENLKHRKQMLQEGIRKFNWKPKKGIHYLLSGGFIASAEPADVAKFLLTTEGLNKAMIGEYLGEG